MYIARSNNLKRQLKWHSIKGPNLRSLQRLDLVTVRTSALDHYWVPVLGLGCCLLYYSDNIRKFFQPKTNKKANNHTTIDNIKRIRKCIQH